MTTIYSWRSWIAEGMSHKCEVASGNENMRRPHRLHRQHNWCVYFYSSLIRCSTLTIYMLGFFVISVPMHYRRDWKYGLGLSVCSNMWHKIHQIRKVNHLSPYFCIHYSYFGRKYLFTSKYSSLWWPLWLVKLHWSLNQIKWWKILIWLQLQLWQVKVLTHPWREIAKYLHNKGPDIRHQTDMIIHSSIAVMLSWFCYKSFNKPWSYSINFNRVLGSTAFSRDNYTYLKGVHVFLTTF